eukprot:1697204-Prymnesium_polylepis.1
MRAGSTTGPQPALLTRRRPHRRAGAEGGPARVGARVCEGAPPPPPGGPRARADSGQPRLFREGRAWRRPIV